jgi:hypothetical protein
VLTCFSQTVNTTSDPVFKHDTDDNSDIRQGEILDGFAKDSEKPLPLRALLTRPVVVSIGNYCMIGLLDIMGGALIPLVWSTSVEFGGLGMSPASIGLWLAGCGLLNGIFQFVAFPRIVGRFGPRRVFIASTLCFFPIYSLLPFENLALRNYTNGLNLTAALLIALQLMMMCLSCMGFGRFTAPYISFYVFTEVVRINQVRYLCTYPQLRPTGGHSALRMESRRRWSRFSARSDQLLPRLCMHSPWTVAS